MKKLTYIPLYLFIAVQFFILSLPRSTTDKLREEFMAGVFPAWKNMRQVANFLFADDIRIKKDTGNLYQLELENRLLNEQIEGVYEWLLFEERVQEQMDRFHELTSKATAKKAAAKELYWNDFFRRRAEELKQILEIELQSLPGKVLYREPSSWNSCLWINIGEKQNEALGRVIVAKNSPVVIGDKVVGLIEYVGKEASRVRLITDSTVVPSVRAIRGKTQNREITQLIHSLEKRLFDKKELFSNEDEKKQLFDLLLTVKNKLRESKDEWYLAKGEICGSSRPLWRSKGQILKGRGFNYNFSDKEGEKKNLYSNNRNSSCPIIQKGDLLVTTGLDGVFPAGLLVGIVGKVYDIPEGGYAYDIEAEPAITDMNALKIVFVTPPLQKIDEIDRL